MNCKYCLAYKGFTGTDDDPWPIVCELCERESQMDLDAMDTFDDEEDWDAEEEEDGDDPAEGLITYFFNYWQCGMHISESPIKAHNYKEALKVLRERGCVQSENALAWTSW